MQVEINPTLLASITALDSGEHASPGDGVCVMEAVAYVTGLPFSDHPECTCPVITAFMVTWNDALPTDERNALLLPLIPRLVNTRGSKALEARRAAMVADWFVRTHLPAWLRLAGLVTQAETLERHPEITAFTVDPPLLPVLEAILPDADAVFRAAFNADRRAAESEAWSAAGSAGRRAAESAAWSAAWSPVRRTAESADWGADWVEAWIEVWSMAWFAAWFAASIAAEGAVDDTKSSLQSSAVALIERMCALTDEA